MIEFFQMIPDVVKSIGRKQFGKESTKLTYDNMTLVSNIFDYNNILYCKTSILFALCWIIMLRS